MKKVLVPLADGFEAIEAVTIIDVLRRSGVEVVVAGLHEGSAQGSHGVSVMPDQLIDRVQGRDYDMVVLPGGQPGVDHLRQDARVIGLVRSMKKEGKVIGAICAAPLVLRDAGLAAGIQLTSHPSVESELSASDYQKTRVVTDGKIITSRGPGTAMEFALTLVEILAGPQKVRELSAAMLTP